MAFFDDKNLLVLGGAYGGLCIRADATYEHGQEYRHIGKELVLKKADGVKISVILPVYNVEPWIGECIESLKKQKQEGLEFIFVDDCGTDNSMKIVESWAAEDKRVRILRNNENSGSGPSRNLGIEAACGEYLSFIDPDDMISDNFFDLLYNKAKETGADIVKGSCRTIDFEGHIEETPKNNVIRECKKSNTPIWYMFDNEHFSAIYKNELFSNQSVRFGMSRVSQDITYLLRVGSVAKDIEIENRAIYYYVKREGSATDKWNAERAEAMLQGLEEKRLALLIHGDSKYVRMYFDRYIRWCNDVVYKCIHAGHIKEKERRALIGRFNIIIMSLPHATKYMEDIPEISLLKYGITLIPIRGTALDRLSAWTDLLTQHPELADEYKKTYRKIADRALREGSLRERWIVRKKIRHIEKKFGTAILRQTGSNADRQTD